MSSSSSNASFEIFVRSGTHRPAARNGGPIRLPAIISWPGTLVEGAVRDQLSHACDWAPTLLQLCDIESKVEKFDGQSLVEILHDEEAASPPNAVHWDLGGQGAVRQGAWKLIHNVRATAGPKLAEEDQEWFLSNLKEDRGETKNYASFERQVVKRLRQAHKAMRAKEK